MIRNRRKNENMNNRKTISLLLITMLLALLLLAGAQAEDSVDYGGRTLPTPIPVAEPTAEPQPPALTPGDQTGSVRIRAFNDKNRNAEQGFAEENVANIRFWLLNEAGEAVYAGKTDNNGEALAEGVPEGSYRLRVYTLPDWGFTTKSEFTGLGYSCVEETLEESADSSLFTVTAGQEKELGVGLYRTPHISGTCWMDTSGDGVWQEGEPRMPAVHITLDGQKNGLHYETWSAEDGSWRINWIRPGFYTISVEAPDGMMFARYSKTGGNKRSIFSGDDVKGARTIDTNDKENKENQNIGFIWSARVVGRCFLDANYNGLYDEGEQPLAGVKVTAIKQAKDEEVEVTFSAADGTYLLDGLRGNTYKIRAVLPADGVNFTRVVTDPLGNHFQARPDRRENFWENFTLQEGEQKTVNVGAIYPATVTGTVYMDDDFSADMNGKEKIVSGFLVSLANEDGEIVASDKTSIKGKYELTGIAPGNYSLRVTALSGYAFTRQGEGNVILNRTGGEGYSEFFPVALGEEITGMDIGMILPAVLRGSVFADRNDNGLQDSDEAGFAGTTVKLLREDGTEAFRAEIGEDGAFLFDAVMPGSYCLEYTIPDGAIFAKTAAGGNRIEGEGNTGRGGWLNIRSGDSLTADLCGALTLGKISGIAFADPEADGVPGDGNALLSGVAITLTPGRADLEAVTVTTGEDGAFTLENLHPDTYQLTVSAPEGRVISRTDRLDLPLEPGKDEQTVSLTVEMGQERNGQEIGCVLPAGLKGRVWLDENNNGVYDDGEATPKGIVITVTDDQNGSVFSKLKTDKKGRFETAGMIPGSFSLSCEMDEDMMEAKEGDSDFTRDGNRLVMEHITLGENETRKGIMMGFVRFTSMGGSAWIDRGEGREPLPGVEVLLLDEQGNTVQTMTTGEDGDYLFSRLMPGTYVIESRMPSGSIAVDPQDERLQNGFTSIAVHTSGRTGTSDPIELKMGGDLTGLDVGCVLSGRLGDVCWLDLNKDGLQDNDEPGIPNVRIELLRNGETVAETVTDQYGFYRFDDIYPAVYTLRVTAPKEVRPTKQRPDVRLISSVLEETDDTTCLSIELTVESGRANYNADLGFICRKAGVLPAGVGMGKTQDWTPYKSSEEE